MMALTRIQVIPQSMSTTLQWVGFYDGIRALPGDRGRQTLWIVASAAVFAGWQFAVVLSGSQNVFHSDVLPPRIPMAMLATLAVGYLLLISGTFRGIIAGIPQYWLIGIQP